MYFLLALYIHNIFFLISQILLAKRVYFFLKDVFLRRIPFLKKTKSEVFSNSITFRGLLKVMNFYRTISKKRNYLE